MADEAEIEVEIVDAPKPGDEQPKLVAKIVTPEEGVDELKRKLTEQQRQTEEERSRRLQAEGRVQSITVEKQDSEVAQVVSAIDTIKQRLEVARGNYRTARANSDVDAELEATELIAQSKADISDLERGKAMIEARKSNPQPQRIQYTDPVEALASTLEPASAAWVRAHPEYARDPAKYQEMVAASNWAIAKGNAANTPAYFRKVEEMLDLASAAVTTTSEATTSNAENPMSSASRSVPPAAAPVSRNGAGPGQPRPGTFQLTREQAEIAVASFPDMKPVDAHRAYARNLTELRATGRLN